MENPTTDASDVLEVLAAATRAFLDALRHPDWPRTIAVEVEGSYAAGVVKVSLHDYGGRNGNTVELQRPLKPARRKAVAASIASL